MTLDRRRFLAGGGAFLGAGLLGGCGSGRSAPEGVPRSDFDDDSTAEEVTEGIDLSGKIAVVTGCTSGIGFETMRVLAKRGCYVVGTSRSLDRAAEACREVVGVTTPLELELSDPWSIVACADQIRSLNSPIDMLICNAGYRGGGNDRELVRGVEKHFAINHLGHFLLVNRIIDRLFFATQGRVVIVASRTAYTKAPETGIQFDDLTLTDDYSDSMAYGHSKLANVLFSLGLARRLKGTRITSNALHPAVINTEIDRNLNGFMQFMFGVLTFVSGNSVEEGAATSCYVATSPRLGATSGAYFEDCNAVTIEDSHLADEAMADRLWDVSVDMLSGHYITHEVPTWEDFRDGVRGERSPDAD